MNDLLPPLPDHPTADCWTDAEISAICAYARSAVEAALRDAAQAEGWVMVPVEPTNAMVGRFFDAIEGGPDWDDTPDDDDDKVEAFAEFSKGYRAMLAATPSAPTAVEPNERATCEWTLEDDDNGTWQSSCGELWQFIEGGPKENRVSFCHNCGKPAIVRASKGTP